MTPEIAAVKMKIASDITSQVFELSADIPALDRTLSQLPIENMPDIELLAWLRSSIVYLDLLPSWKTVMARLEQRMIDTETTNKFKGIVKLSSEIRKVSYLSTAAALYPWAQFMIVDETSDLLKYYNFQERSKGRMSFRNLPEIRYLVFEFFDDAMLWKMSF